MMSGKYGRFSVILVLFVLLTAWSGNTDGKPHCLVEGQPDTIAEQKADSLGDGRHVLKRDLDEMVVSSRRIPVRHSETQRSVQIVTRKQIMESAARDLASVLASVRSVDVRHRGTFGMQSDLIIRGGTFDQSLVLLNGINVTDPQTGHHNLNLPVDLMSIERIEVLHGPGARIFGPNAFSGAVNIITSDPGESRVNLSLTGGQHRFGHAGASAGFRSGPVFHHVSLSGMTSDGYITNTDFHTGSFFYRSRVGWESGRLDLQAGYQEKAFGANSFYTPRFPDQYEHTRTGFLSLRWLPEGRLRLTPAIYWRRHHDRFELFRHEAPDWYAGHNYHRTDIAGLTVNWARSTDFGTFSSGIDLRHEYILSNVLGHPLSSPRPVPSHLTRSGAEYTHSHSRTGISFMAEHSVTIGAVSLSGGALLFSSTDLDTPVTLFPGVDVAWQLTGALRWYATANRTLRLPTFTDLFYSGPDNLGNPDLQPEEAVSLETGFKLQQSGWHADIAVFQRRGVNMIDWIRQAGEDVWRSENLTRVVMTGFEAGVVIVMDQATLSAQYTWLHADRQSGEFLSNYALDHLAHKVDLSMAVPFHLPLPLLRRGGVRTNLIWQDRAGGYLHYDGNSFTGVKPFEPFWLVDGKLFFDNGPSRVFVEASNLWNSRYVDIGNVPQPGRWVRAGMELGL